MMEHVRSHTWQKIMDQECCPTTTDISVFPHVFPPVVKPDTGDEQNHGFRWLIICRCSVAARRWLYTVGLINSTPPDYYWFWFQKLFFKPQNGDDWWVFQSTSWRHKRLFPQSRLNIGLLTVHFCLHTSQQQKHSQSNLMSSAELNNWVRLNPLPLWLSCSSLM